MNSTLPLPTIRVLLVLLAVSIPAGAGADAVPGITDAEIVRRAYDPSFSSPPGFYRDPALGGDATLVVVGEPEKDAVARTRSEALRRVRREIASSNVPQIQGERPDDATETEKYFDFKVGSYWWRVHKESYFEWKESTQFLAPSFTSGLPRTVGALRRRPVGEAEASAFAEYHQVITGQILGGSKIVRTDRARTPNGWVVTFTEARVNTPNVSPLTYNTIDVWANTYAIDRETGVVVKSRVHVASLRGKDRPVFGPGTPVPP